MLLDGFNEAEKDVSVTPVPPNVIAKASSPNCIDDDGLVTVLSDKLGSAVAAVFDGKSTPTNNLSPDPPVNPVAEFAIVMLLKSVVIGVLPIWPAVSIVSVIDVEEASVAVMFKLDALISATSSSTNCALELPAGTKAVLVPAAPLASTSASKVTEVPSASVNVITLVSAGLPVKSNCAVAFTNEPNYNPTAIGAPVVVVKL